MRRRILTAILGVTAVAIILFGVPLGFVVQRLVDEGETLKVERLVVLAAQAVPADFATSGDPIELPSNSDGVIFALYDTQGLLISGSGPFPADAITVQALGGEVTDTEKAENLIIAVPLTADEAVLGAIRAEQSTAVVDARIERLLALLGALGVGVLAVGGLIGWWVAGRLIQPVLGLRDAALDLGDGDFTIEVQTSGVLEIDQVGEAMTSTARRLDETLNRERTFSADVSHQIRTPLAGLRAAIETEMEFPRPERTDVLEEAITDLDRLERTVSELLAIARAGAGQTSVAVSLDEVLADVETEWKPRFRRLGRMLVVSNARFSPAVTGSKAALRHALDALLDNALKHGDGEVRIDVIAGGDSVSLRISDEGTGFARSEPSFDQADERDGGESAGGLGLRLVKRMVESMPGRVVVVRPGSHPQIDIVLKRADSGPDGSSIV